MANSTSSPDREREPDLAELARTLAERLTRSVDSGEGPSLPSDLVQSLTALMCRVYGADSEAGVDYPILARRDAVSSTDVMVVCSALLRAADLQVFELGMWSSWTGR